MDLIDKINALSLRCKSHGKNLTNEEQTKMTLILPFIQMLGYDVFNPLEVVPEYTASMGVKKEDRVDYALMKDGEPIILVECKTYGTDLDVQKCSQLMRYFHATPAHVGILTDGNKYQLYSDLIEAHKMDDKPYIEFSLEDFKEVAAPAIKRLMKESFELDPLQQEALNLKYAREFKNILSAQFENVSVDFARLFIQRVYDSKITQKQLDKFLPILKRAMSSWLNDEVNKRLTNAMKENDKEPETPPAEDKGIVTTEDETQAYHIITAICSEVVPPEKITLNDCKSFCNILFDGKQTKRIARLYSKNDKVYWISFTDENNNEADGTHLENVIEIYKYADKLKAIAKRYE